MQSELFNASNENAASQAAFSLTIARNAHASLNFPTSRLSVLA